MHAEDVVIDDRGQGQAVKHRVAPFPHLLAQLVSEPVLPCVRYLTGHEDTRGNENGVVFFCLPSLLLSSAPLAPILPYD